MSKNEKKKFDWGEKNPEKQLQINAGQFNIFLTAAKMFLLTKGIDPKEIEKGKHSNNSNTDKDFV